MNISIRGTLGLLLGTFFVSHCLLIPQASAVEFVIVGPRAVGMGGAGVAVTTDSLATYWNPAGLAMSKDIDIRIQGSAQAIDRADTLNTLEQIQDIDTSDISQGNIDRLQGLLNQLNNGSVSALGSAGLYFKGYFGEHFFGMNVSVVGTSGLYAPVPLGASASGTDVIVNGTLRANGLAAEQISFSYAYAFADKKLAIGVTPKVMQGVAYSSAVGVFEAGDNEFEFRSDLGKPEISTQFGLDAGAVYRPVSWFRIGIVGKDLTEPTFDAPGGQEFKLNPQVRGGLAVNPYDSLTIAFDGDITSNKTLVPDLKSQVLSFGAEQTLLSVLALRLGVLKNVQDAKSKLTPTAGLGLKIAAFQLDLAGGYDFNQQGALLSGSLALTF